MEGWRFTLQAPSYTAVMTYLDDRGIREQMYHAFMTRATTGELDNRAMIGRIVELRQAKAEVLGFKTFADLVLEERMAQNGERARQLSTTCMTQEETLLPLGECGPGGLSQQLEGEPAPSLEPWDIAYYAEKLRAGYTSSMKRLCGLTSRWNKWSAGMFDLVPEYMESKSSRNRAFQLGSCSQVLPDPR